MFKRTFLAAAALSISGLVHAVPVDLSSWTAEPGGNWVLSQTTVPNDTATQTINGNPTTLFDGTQNAQNRSLSGTIEVLVTGDDDFIGFVLGYQAGEIATPNDGFYLVDWKQGDQSPAVDGLALSHVTGPIGSDNDYWQHVGGVTEVARATNLGSTGWVDQTAYMFDLVFTDSLIQVSVDGVLEISYAAPGGTTFADGGFGFYNYSQGNVRYAGITSVDCSDPANANDPACIIITPGVPEPGTLLLLGLGAAGLGWSRRKRV